jgi:hypothetical protein
LAQPHAGVSSGGSGPPGRLQHPGSDPLLVSTVPRCGRSSPLRSDQHPDGVLERPGGHATTTCDVPGLRDRPVAQHPARAGGKRSALCARRTDPRTRGPNFTQHTPPQSHGRAVERHNRPTAGHGSGGSDRERDYGQQGRGPSRADRPNHCSDPPAGRGRRGSSRRRTRRGRRRPHGHPPDSPRDEAHGLGSRRPEGRDDGPCPGYWATLNWWRDREPPPRGEDGACRQRPPFKYDPTGTGSASTLPPTAWQ